MPRRAAAAPVPASPAPPPKKSVPVTTSRPTRARKLSFAEKEELAGLPDRIDAREREREQLYLSLAEPALLRDGAAIAAAHARLAAVETDIAKLTARWEALETIATSQNA